MPLGVAGIVLFTAWPGLGWGGETAMRAVSDFGTLGAAVLGGVACLTTRRRVQGALAPPCARRSTGLGLSISKAIVERHGGRIGCESAGPGRGATFSFELPLLAPPAAPATPLATPVAA